MTRLKGASEMHPCQLGYDFKLIVYPSFEKSLKEPKGEMKYI